MNPTAVRLGLVCALALASAFLPGAALAHEDLTGAFPFLSIDPSQLRSLKAAFLLQWKLLRGFGETSALYYVGLVAALVGGLSIIFVRKSQDTRTVVAWLLTVTICLFAPYNSRLLFYPTVLKTDPEGLTVAADERCDKSKTFVACGFTPQLVMAHVGTTLQVIFADLFRSGEFKGMVEGALASVALTNAEMLKTSGSWLGDANEYTTTCPGAKILPSEMTGKDGGQGKAPYTLASAFDRISGHYANTARSGVEADFRTGPPAIVLDWQANSTNASYAAAVGAICDRVVGGGSGSAAQIEACSENGRSDRGQKASEALLKLAKEANKTPDPGSLLFYLAGPSGGTSSGRVDSGVDAARASVSGCMMDASGLVERSIDGVKNRIEWNSYCSAYWQRAGWAYGAYDNKDAGLAGPYVNAEMTPEMVALLRSFDRAPASVREFPTASRPFETAGRCSVARGNALFEALFDNGLVERDTAWTADSMANNMFKRLREKIKDTGSLPKTWTYADITDTDCVGMKLWAGQDKVCATAKNILSVLNSEQFFDGAVTEAEKRRRIADLVVGSVMPSTAIHGQSEASSESAAGVGLHPSVVGAFQDSPWTGGLLGKVITWLGGGLVSIMSNFIGPFSIAVLQFCRVIIDMVMVGVIVVTPFILLLGIAMPPHAAGILIQIILVVGILKLVPVVFLIVDNLAGIVYRTFTVIGGDDPNLKKGIFIFAIAGIYTHIVGITLFMLFKIGNVQNIEALKQIDTGAQKIADAGKKAAIAVGMAIAGVAGGAAAGAIGSAARGKTAKEVADAAMEGATGAAGEQLRSAVGGSAVEQFKKGYGPNDMPPDEGSVPEGPINPDAPDGSGEQETVEQAAWEPTAETRASARRAFRAASGREPDVGSGFDQSVLSGMGRSIEEGATEGEVASLYRAVGVGPAGSPIHGVGALSPGGAAVGHLAGGPGGVQAGGQIVAQGGVQTQGGVQAQGGASGAGQGGGQGPQQPAAPVSPQQAAVNRLDEDEKELRAKYAKLEQNGLRITNVDEIAAAMQSTSGKIADDAARALVAAQGRGTVGKPVDDPGVLMSAASGAMGGFMANSGITKIPVIGDIIKGVADEYYEAPERARMWKDPNIGFSGWWKAQGDARRAQFLEKEASTYATGVRYREMGALGSYDGVWKAARKAAAEAAAKVRDERDAISLSEADRGGRMLTSDDFRGASLINALQSLESGLQAAALQQKGTVQVGDGKVEVKLTPAVLKELVASKATKGMSATVDELMLGHVYLNEKDVRHGTGGRTRGDAAAIAKFVREDIGTDYQIGALAKMQQGKDSFYRQKGIVKRFREDLAVEAVMLEKFKKDFPGATKAEIDAYKAKLPVSRFYANSLEQSYAQMALGGYRAKYADHARDLKYQASQLSQMHQQASRFAAKANLILSDLTVLGQQVNAGHAVINGLDQALQNIAGNAHARAALARSGQDSAKKAYILQVFEDAGADEATVNRLRMQIP